MEYWPSKIGKEKKRETRVDRFYLGGQGLISCCCITEEKEKWSIQMFTAEILNQDVTVCLVMRLFLSPSYNRNIFKSKLMLDKNIGTFSAEYLIKPKPFISK
jgi:hypothetical protein